MLVLSRRIGEEVLIGPDVRCLIVDIRPESIRLGFTAPRSISINRAEVAASKLLDNPSALGDSVEGNDAEKKELTDKVEWISDQWARSRALLLMKQHGSTWEAAMVEAKRNVRKEISLWTTGEI